MNSTELHQYEHLDAAQAYFLYLDFGIEDDRSRKREERQAWLELMYAAMTLHEYNELKDLPDIIIYETIPESPQVITELEHLLPITGSEAIGNLALEQACDKDDRRVSSTVVNSALHSRQQP